MEPVKQTAAPAQDTASTANDFRLGGDISVHRLGFGAMRLARGGWNGPTRDPETGRAVLRRAVELGVNHIDTADYYRSGDGAVRANTLIREALHPYPSGLVIATKVGPIFGPSGPSHAGAADLRALVEANLESLGLDRLDLVYLRIGMMTPPHGESLSERFEALAALREEGLIRHLGLSNVDADHVAAARGIAPIAAVQNNFHIAKRDEAAMLDACARRPHRLRPLRSNRGRPHRPQQRASGQGRGPARRNRLANRAGVAVQDLAGHSGHPRHRVRGSPRGKHGVRARSLSPSKMSPSLA